MEYYLQIKRVNYWYTQEDAHKDIILSKKSQTWKNWIPYDAIYMKLYYSQN